MSTQKSCARKNLRTLKERHVGFLESETARPTQEPNDVVSVESEDDNDQIETARPTQEPNDIVSVESEDDDEPAFKKPRLLCPVRGLDKRNILTPPMTAPSAKTSSNEDSYTLGTRRRTRGTAQGKPNVNYNMKYHPMDDFTRPRRTARILGLRYDSASPPDIGRNGSDEEDEASDEVDYDLIVERTASRHTDSRASRRSSRPQATKAVLYNEKIHPQDYAIFEPRRKPGPRKLCRPRSRKQADVIELSSEIADSDVEESSSTMNMQHSQHGGDEGETIAVLQYQTGADTDTDTDSDTTMEAGDIEREKSRSASHSPNGLALVSHENSSPDGKSFEKAATILEAMGEGSEDEDPNEDLEQLAVNEAISPYATAASRTSHLQTQIQASDADNSKAGVSFCTFPKSITPKSSQMPKRHMILQPNALPRIPSNSAGQKTSFRSSSGESNALGGHSQSYFDDQMAVTEHHQPCALGPSHAKGEAIGCVIPGDELDDELLAGIENVRD